MLLHEGLGKKTEDKWRQEEESEEAGSSNEVRKRIHLKMHCHHNTDMQANSSFRNKYARTLNKVLASDGTEIIITGRCCSYLMCAILCLQETFEKVEEHRADCECFAA